jgi:hypothetical protein
MRMPAVEVVVQAGDATAVAALEVVVPDEKVEDEALADAKAEVVLVEEGAKVVVNRKSEMKLPLLLHQLSSP